jgi:hypothetical protein
VRSGLLLLLGLFAFAAPAGDDAGALLIAISEPPSERLTPPALIAPGAPPILSFRYFDASDRGRFGNLGLMTDDAGH